MSKPTTIYLVRHAESESNKAGLASGHHDNPALTDKGKIQAAETREQLKHIGHDAVYTSDLIRAVQTAEIIHGKEVPDQNKLKQLREKDLGDVDGMSMKYLHDIYYATIELPENDRWYYRHNPKAETDGEVGDRLLREVSELAGKHPGETIIIVTHGICIRTILMRLGYAKHEDFPPGSFSNAGYAVITYDGKNYGVKEVVGHKKPQP